MLIYQHQSEPLQAALDCLTLDNDQQDELKLEFNDSLMIETKTGEQP